MQDGMRLTNLPVLTTQEPRARGKARADKLGGRGGALALIYFTHFDPTFPGHGTLATRTPRLAGSAAHGARPTVHSL